MLKSTYTNHDECLKAILEICGLERFDLDPTYSKGNFYKSIPKPRICGDLDEECGVLPMDSRSTGLQDNSMGSIMFDPPFLATKGPSLGTTKGNLTVGRFKCYPDEKMLHQFYVDSLREFWRILKPNGFLIFKCQDKVSSGKQYFSHIYIHNWALLIGFYPKDLLIYIHPTRIISGKHSNQQHVRKFHSYYFIFQKMRPKVRPDDLVEV